MRPHGQQIAVVGMAVHFPGAQTTKQFWENILAKRRQFRAIPHKRLHPDYVDPLGQDPYRTNLNRMAVIDGFSFDWARRRIPEVTFKHTDIAHLIGLNVALDMLHDAGYEEGKGLPRDKTTVVIGNSNTSEFVRAHCHLRAPFGIKMIRRALAQILHEHPSLELDDAVIATMERAAVDSMRGLFPEPTEDYLPGVMASTIAGRICNYLDLNGGGFVVDAACASSLLAIQTAAERLCNGDADFAIAGGIDISLDPFELVGFTRNGALTTGEMRVYDQRGDGFLPGEGAGFVGLKRLEDVTSKEHVYAVLDRWAISSDGSGGITAPNVAGQKLAIERAHSQSQSGFVSMAEGHGTGTTLGDKVELSALAAGFASAYQGEGHPPPVGVTSIKTLFGHTKSAAGVAGFIKAALSVNRFVLPPLANKGGFLPHACFGEFSNQLYPILSGQVCSKNEFEQGSMRASVSGMGFGGINVHCSLRSPPPPVSAPPSPHWLDSVNERTAMASAQDSEVFLFAAADDVDMAASLRSIQTEAAKCTDAELTDLAAHLANVTATATHSRLSKPRRCAIVASGADEFTEKIETLIKHISNNNDGNNDNNNRNHNSNRTLLDERNQLALGAYLAPDGGNIADVGWLFPGQGSQKINTARVLVERFGWAADMVEQLATPEMKRVMFPAHFDQIRHNQRRMQELRSNLMRTQLTQPCVALSSLLWVSHLRRMGLTPCAVAGHSLGELTALHSAGLLGDATDLIEVARMRGEIMAEVAAETPGAMISLQCDILQAQALLDAYALTVDQKPILTIANINAADETVISGEAGSVNKLQSFASSRNIGCMMLPVSAAFHCEQIMHSAGERLAHQLSLEKAGLEHGVLRAARGRRSSGPQVVSSRTGDLLELASGTATATGAPALTLAKHLQQCLVAPVQWLSVSRTMAEMVGDDGILLEVGPSNVLANLTSRNLNADGGDGPAACSVESTIGSFSSFNWFVAQAYVRGVSMDASPLFADRVVRTWTPPSEMSFLMNPFEREPFGSQEVSSTDCWNVEHVSASAPILTTSPEATTTATDTTTTTGKSKIVKSTSTLDALIDSSANVTGFDQQHIQRDMNLLSDLNLDSIKSRMILSNVFDTVGLRSTEPLLSADGQSILELQAATIGEIAASIDAALVVQNSDSTDADAGAETLADSNDFVFRSLPSWVRSYEMVEEAVPAFSERTKIRSSGDGDSDSDSKLFNLELVFFDKAGELLAQQIARVCQLGGYDAQSISMRMLDMSDDSESLSPSSPSARGGGGEHEQIRTAAVLPVSDCLDMNKNTLRYDVAALLKIAKKTVRTRNLTLVSRDAGHRSIRGFAASVHLERPRSAITLAEFDRAVADEKVAAEIGARLLLPGGQEKPFEFVQYLTRGGETGGGYVESVTSVPRMLKFHADKHDKHEAWQWCEDDVVVVSGGGKGITSECALGFAQETQARLALFGSSPTNSQSVQETLQRFAQQQLVAKYYVCDITDVGQVSSVIKQVQQEMGTITGLIHGAGLNHPQRVEHTSVDGAMAQMAPKLLGLANICDALVRQREREVEVEVEPMKFKFLSAISSIASVTGIHGNSWYSYANGQLNFVLDRCRQAMAKIDRDRGNGPVVKCVDFSLWKNSGMAAQVISPMEAKLIGANLFIVSPMTPSEAVEAFVQICMQEVQQQQPMSSTAAGGEVIVASRLGNAEYGHAWPTVSETRSLEMERWLQGNPLADRILFYEPGVELVTERHLNHEEDVYLKSHSFTGLYLFPAVMGLEAMAQSATALLELEQPETNPNHDLHFRIRNFQLNEIVLVHPQHGKTIRIVARMLPGEDASVEVCLFVPTAAGPIWSADIQVTSSSGDSQSQLAPCQHDTPAFVEQYYRGGAGRSADLEPQRHLYGKEAALFHGPLMRPLQSVYHADEHDAVCTVKAKRTDLEGQRFFCGDKEHTSFLLGDPAFRDGLLQCHMLVDYGLTSGAIPTAIDEWNIRPGPLRRMNKRAQSEGSCALPCRVHVVARPSEPSGMVYNIDVMDSSGTWCVETMRGTTANHFNVVHGEMRVPPSERLHPQRLDEQVFAKALEKARASSVLNVELPEQCLLDCTPHMHLAHAEQRHAEQSKRIARAVKVRNVYDGDITTPKPVPVPVVRLVWDEFGAPAVLLEQEVETGQKKQSSAVSQSSVSISHNSNHSLYVLQLPEVMDMNMDRNLRKQNYWQQGCDIEHMHDRYESMDEWLKHFDGLLPREGTRLILERLVFGLADHERGRGDADADRDRLSDAGTRLWTVYEAAIKSMKAQAARAVHINHVSIVASDGDALLFQIGRGGSKVAEEEELLVLSLKLRLVWPPSNAVAIVVKRKEDVAVNK